MNVLSIRPAKSSRAKCLRCKEPIIKGEGIAYVNNYGWNYRKGYLCYKCSKLCIKDMISHYKNRLVQIDEVNDVPLGELNKHKMARML